MASNVRFKTKKKDYNKTRGKNLKAVFVSQIRCCSGEDISL